MANSSRVHPSVELDGTRLKRDRKQAGYTQVSFAAACDSVSLATVRRAEQGFRVIETSLNRIAQVLNHPVSRYVIEAPMRDMSDYTARLDGDWTSFYVESERGVAPFVVTEDVVIRQEGQRIQGELASIGITPQRHEKFVECSVLNNVVTGFIVSKDCTSPAGLASFNMMLSRRNCWLDGHTAWFDVDTDQIENSRNILVRKSSSNYQRYMEEARYHMEREIITFRLRKLLEGGYSVSDAVTMVQAVEKNRSPRAGLPAERPLDSNTFKIESAAFLKRTGQSFSQFLDCLIEMDYKNIGFYDEADEGTTSQWAPIFEAQPACWRLLTLNDTIMGYWHFCALPPEMMAEVKAGRLRDSEITLDKVDLLTQPGDYALYLVSIVPEPEVRFGHPFKMLLDSLLEAIENFARKSVFFSEIVFTAWSPASVKLANRLGCTKIGEIKQQGQEVPIYQTSLLELLNDHFTDDFTSLQQAYARR